MKKFLAYSLPVTLCAMVCVGMLPADAKNHKNPAVSGCPAELQGTAAWCGENSQGLTKFKERKTQKWGYFDSESKSIVIEPRFKFADNFKFMKARDGMKEDFAFVLNEKGKGEYINRDGQKVTMPEELK